MPSSAPISVSVGLRWSLFSILPNPPTHPPGKVFSGPNLRLIWITIWFYITSLDINGISQWWQFKTLIRIKIHQCEKIHKSAFSLRLFCSFNSFQAFTKNHSIFFYQAHSKIQLKLDRYWLWSQFHNDIFSSRISSRVCASIKLINFILMTYSY